MKYLIIIALTLMSCSDSEDLTLTACEQLLADYELRWDKTPTAAGMEYLRNNYNREAVALDCSITRLH